MRGGEYRPGLGQHGVGIVWRRRVGALRRHRLVVGLFGNLEAALFDLQGPEIRFLRLRVGELCRVAAGENLFAAVLVERDDGNRHVVEDAAGSPLGGQIAGEHIGPGGALIAFDEAFEIFRGLRLAEIAPGAGIFLPVDGIVERSDDCRRIRPVVEVAGLVGRKCLSRQVAKDQNRRHCAKDGSHADSPVRTSRD